MLIAFAVGAVVGLVCGCMLRVAGHADQGKDAWLVGYNEGYSDGKGGR